MSGRVAAVLLSPVKGLRVVARSEVHVGARGVRDDRRFFLIDADGRMVNGKRFGALQTVIADFSDEQRTLTLRFPDGSVLSEPLQSGRRLSARFFSRTVAAVEVLGPWSQALSDHVGTPLSLVESVGDWGAVDRGEHGAVSLISSASIELLTAAAAAAAPIDARRFRMLFEVDGVAAHAEDGWIGRPLRIGEAVVMALGHVGRCLVTKRDPESGLPDLETLDALASYRPRGETTEPLAFGVHGKVLEAGTVRVGDAVDLL